MSGASLVKIEEILLVTFQDEAGSDTSEALVAQLGDSVVGSGARGVLIDASGLSLVDSYMARILASLVGMSRLLGADAIIAGIRPDVALTMVELGIVMSDIATVLNVDIGLANLRARIGSRA
jgi:rsbT antagonist protein RsbS